MFSHLSRLGSPGLEMGTEARGGVGLGISWPRPRPGQRLSVVRGAISCGLYPL